jgi:hypothetical protein
MIRQSYTAIVERNVEFREEFTTEPYECGWASEAIFFIRKLDAEGNVPGTVVKVQISPDGIHWCDEGTMFTLTDQEVDSCKVSHFGNWLRLAGELSEDAGVKVIVALCLKE